MKKTNREGRNKLVVVRFNAAEYTRLHHLFKQTTERHLSPYLRKVLLHKPLIVTYRNRSADDFLREMIQLKKELNAIGNNFNQAVQKLILLEKIPDFRCWVQEYAHSKEAVALNIEAIQQKTTQLYEQWLQK